jgi:hypothetical protein
MIGYQRILLRPNLDKQWAHGGVRHNDADADETGGQ